jgi:NAD(P)-dependent dehydrogenase (short-subunit alcohol dehydrogenase family)
VLLTGGTRGIGAAVVPRLQLAGARDAATARSTPAEHVDGGVFIAAVIGTAAGADAIVSRLGRARHPGEQRRRRRDQVAKAIAPRLFD